MLYFIHALAVRSVLVLKLAAVEGVRAFSFSADLGFQGILTASNGAVISTKAPITTSVVIPSPPVNGLLLVSCKLLGKGVQP